MIKKGFFFLVLFTISWNSWSQQIAQKEDRPQYEFIENKGQFHPLAKYRAAIPYGHLFLEGGSILYDLVDPLDYHRIQQWKHDHPATISKEIPARHAIRISFEGVQYAPKTTSRHYQSHYYNYFLGSNSEKWASKIHPSSEVVYENVIQG